MLLRRRPEAGLSRNNAKRAVRLLFPAARMLPQGVRLVISSRRAGRVLAWCPSTDSGRGASDQQFPCAGRRGDRSLPTSYDRTGWASNGPRSGPMPPAAVTPGRQAQDRGAGNAPHLRDWKSAANVLNTRWRVSPFRAEEHGVTPPTLRRSSGLGDSSTVEQRTLTPLIQARILVPQPLILRPFSPSTLEQPGPVGRSVGNFRSPFELSDRTLGERRVTVQTVRIEDRANVPERMPGDGGDLRLGATSRAGARKSGIKKIGGVIADHPRNRSAAVLPLLAALFLPATLLSHSSSY